MANYGHPEGESMAVGSAILNRTCWMGFSVQVLTVIVHVKKSCSDSNLSVFFYLNIRIMKTHNSK